VDRARGAWNPDAARPVHRRTKYLSIKSMAALARDDRRERRRTEATRSYDAERQNNGAPTRSYMSALLRINVGSCDLAEQGEEEQYVSLAVGSSTASVEFDQAAEVVVDLATPLPLVLKVLDRAAGDRELASATVDLRGAVPRWEDTAPAEGAAALSDGLANLACVDSEDGAVLRMAVEYERDGSLCFARRHKSLALADGDTVATRSKWDGRYHTAASAAVMSDGRHFAQFTVLRGRHVMAGVIRPGWDVGSGEGNKTVFLSHFYIKMMILPRQARDKHREITQKRLFCCRCTARGRPLLFLVRRRHTLPWG
jgi:hypothetical protein